MSTNCDMNPTDIMNKIYEIVAILQTLRTLITQLNSMCINSFFRSMFTVFFYFTPQLNPYIWADAYAEAVKKHEAKKQAAAAEAKTREAHGHSTGVDGADEVRKTSAGECECEDEPISEDVIAAL